jgi:beta-galactosidase
VYVLLKPENHIADFHVRTPLEFDGNCNLVSARFEVDVDLDAASGDALANLEVRVALYSMPSDRQDLSEPLLQLAGSPKPLWLARDPSGSRREAATRTGGRVSLVADATTLGGAAPRLWSAEEPHLYLLAIHLVRTGEDAAGGSGHSGILEMEACQVGFRRTEVSGGQLLHNSRAIMIKGANRHEHDQRHGKRVTLEGMLLDAQLMKQLNFNAVRCAHYPNHPLWYEVCAKLGLYLVDEANVETHGFDPGLTNNAINPACSPAWHGAIVGEETQPPCVLSYISASLIRNLFDTEHGGTDCVSCHYADRAMRMAQRDKNHPAIILWSLGNESGFGAAHVAAAAALRALDPSRPLHYEGGGSRTSATDIVCPMYARVHQALALGNDPGETRPVILCEYAHAMGNSTGNLREYWEAFESHPRLQGGFIWEWADQAMLKPFVLPNGTTAKRWAYGGDFGDEPNDAQFICDGLVWPDRTPHPAAFEAKALQAPIAIELVPSAPHQVRVRVTNNQMFASTEGFAMSWTLLRDGIPASFVGTVYQGADWEPLDTEGPIFPGQNREVLISLEKYSWFKSSMPAIETSIVVVVQLARSTSWAPKVSL